MTEFRADTDGQGSVSLGRISSEVVSLYRRHYGKGPTAAKTYAIDDVVVCVLRDGLSPVEKTLFEAGRAETVREMRSAFHEAVEEQFSEVVERLTGRRVVAFMSQAHVDPDLVVEVFVLEGAVLPGRFGETNLEMLEGEQGEDGG